MGEGPIDTAGNRHLAGRYCITRIPLALALAGGALWLRVEPDQTVLPLVLWLLIGLWAVLGIWGAAISEGYEGLKAGFCGWPALLVQSVAAVAMFAADHTAMAVVALLFLICGLSLAVIAHRATRGRQGTDENKSDPLFGWPMAIHLVFLASSLWLAFGGAPDWAANVIRGVFWTISALLISLSLLAGFIFTTMAWTKNAGNAVTRQPAREQKSGATLERERTTAERLVIWLSRAIVLTTAGALWVAGQNWLAVCYLLAILMLIAVRSETRRFNFGENTRFDFFTRMIRFLVWWPVVAVAVVIIAMVVIPIVAVAGVVDWFSNRSKAKGWERKERLRNARIKRAAASYRLREAFGRSGGLVYFLYSEPHQREHFLGQGALLASMEDRVVARDWRVQVMPARSKVGSTKYEQTPEGALLHVNEIGNMQKDLPFIVIVPPKGRVRVFKISEPYRARKRDKGAALAEVEAEIRAAMETTFGPPTE